MSRKRSQASRVLLRLSSSALAVLLLAAVALLPVRSSPARAQKAPPIVLIMGVSFGVTDIAGSIVKAAFQGLRTEYKGMVLVPFNLPPQTPTRVRMDRALLGLEQAEVGRFWIDQRIRDGRAAPRTLPTTDLAVRVVSTLKGAIAGVPADVLSPQIRALRVDGRSHTESGYLLADK